jgi:hypothetical protein
LLERAARIGNRPSRSGCQLRATNNEPVLDAWTVSDRALGDAKARTLDRREKVIDGAVLGSYLDLDALWAVPEEVALRKQLGSKQ